MEKLKNIFNSEYFPLYLLLIVNLIIAVIYISPGFEIANDAVSYGQMIRYIRGAGGSLEINRLLTTPFLLAIASALTSITKNAYDSMAIVNFIFYLLFPIIFYKLAYEVYKERRAAIFASVFFLSNYYFINVNNFFLADFGGWFFLLLTNLLAIRYFQSKNDRYFYMAIASSVVGVFFKEFGALGMVSLGCFMLLSDFSWKEKILKIFKAAGLFIILPLVYHLFIYFKFHYSYFNWYDTSLTFYPAEQKQYGIALFVKVMGWLYLAGWPIFLWGLWQEKKNYLKERSILLLCLLPASLTFFVWPMFMQRTAFILVPWLALISGFGLSKIKNKYLVAAILIIYIFINYNLERLLPIVNLPF
jgi:hypothetical protein